MSKCLNELESSRSLVAVTPPVRGLNVVRVVVAPGASHAFGVLMVRYDVAVVGELYMAERAFSSLFDNLAVHKLPHLCRRPKLAITAWVMGIFNPLHANPYWLPFFSQRLTTAAVE